MSNTIWEDEGMVLSIAIFIIYLASVVTSSPPGYGVFASFSLSNLLNFRKVNNYFNSFRWGYQMIGLYALFLQEITFKFYYFEVYIFDL